VATSSEGTPGLPGQKRRRRGQPAARSRTAYGAPGRGGSTAVSVASALGIFALWWLVTEFGLVKPLFLPSPAAIARRLVRVLEEGFGGASLWQHTAASLFRVFSAFALACATAIPAGIAMGVNRHFRGVLDPPIEFYRPIPPLAYLPLTIIWFGIGELQKVILIYLAIFAPMALSARAGVRSATIEQIHAAFSLGGTRAQVVRHVVLPAALPEILTGMRIGIGFGWTTLVAAEMVAASAGLGFMVLSAAEFLVTEVVVLGILVIGAIAYVFDLGMRFLERRLVPWRGKA
jgi:taurine transport system permease protein